MGLSTTDKDKVKRLIPKASQKVLDAAVARLYIAYPDTTQWTYTGLSGAVLLVDDLVGHTFFLKLVDIQGHHGVLWDQEIYIDFQYNQDRSFFHSFELEDCLAGFLFDDTSDASHFFKRVTQREKHGSKKTLQNKNAIAMKKAPEEPMAPGPRGETHLQNTAAGDQRIRKTTHVLYYDDQPPPEWRSLYRELANAGISEDMIADNKDFIKNYIRQQGGPLVGLEPPVPRKYQNTGLNRAPSAVSTSSSIRKKAPPPPPPTSEAHTNGSSPSRQTPRAPLPQTPSSTEESSIETTPEPEQPSYTSSTPVHRVPPPLTSQPVNRSSLPPTAASAPPQLPPSNARPAPPLPSSSRPIPAPPGNTARPIPQLPARGGLPPPPPSRGAVPPPPPIRGGATALQPQQTGRVPPPAPPSRRTGAPPPAPPPRRAGVAPPAPPSRQPVAAPQQQSYQSYQPQQQQAYTLPPQQQLPAAVPVAPPLPSAQQAIPVAPPLPPAQQAIPVAPPLPPTQQSIPVAPPLPPQAVTTEQYAYPPPPQTSFPTERSVPAPPPLPPMGNNASAPPPPPPVPQMGPGAPQAPPLPTMSAGPTPPLPQPEAGRDALLASIRGSGIGALKKVDKSQLDKPSVLLQEQRGETPSTPSRGGPPGGGGSLADALASALSSRKAKVSRSDDESDGEEW